MHEDIASPPKSALDNAPRRIDNLYEAELLLRDEQDALAFEAEILRTRKEHSRPAVDALPATDRAIVEALTLPETSLRDVARREVARVNERDAIAKRLSGNYEGRMQELALQGRNALRNGARSRGREREDELRDAARLLKAVLDDPIGSRNYGIWFDLGWILWKLGAPLDEALEAFYQASRLSGADRDLLHVQALRHLAHLQGLQGHFEEAYATGQRVLAASAEDPEILLEAARFAARTERRSEAARLVESAISERIGLVFAVLAEPDLAVVHPVAVGLLGRHVAAARQHAASQFARWQTALEKIRAIDTEIGQETTLTDDDALPAETALATTYGLFELQELARNAAVHGDAVFEKGLRSIESVLLQARETAERLRRQIERLHLDRTYWEDSVRKLEEDARIAKITLHPYQWENPLLIRKNARAREARAFYAQCKANLESTEGLIQEQLPTLQADFERADARRARIEQLLAELDAAARSGSGPVAPDLAGVL